MSVVDLASTRRFAFVILIAAVLGGCATLPPGADFPKVSSVALAYPEETRLGALFAGATQAHDGTSGFRIITVGVDGFLTRVQMIDAAERTLDLQYFIFRGDETGRLLTDALLRAADRGVRVRVLIDDGDTVAGDEQIIALGNARGSGQTATLSRYGNYALHAKLFVFDRRKLFIGSMNFDQRSKRLNTEVGLIIDSSELAQQTAARFEAMAQPENSYTPALRPQSVGGPPRLVWRTREGGKTVEYAREPARSRWQRLKVELLSLLPLGGEL